MSPRTPARAAAATAVAIGVGAAVAPSSLVRLYGAGRLAGNGALGWRLFGARNIVVGTAALCGSPAARQMMLITQLPDQLVFLQALRNGSVPRGTAIAAIATSAVVVACTAADAAAAAGDHGGR